MVTSEGLWAASRRARLSTARALSNADLNAIHEELCLGRAEPGWPYGSATSINPLLVILGPSPGNSPKPGDGHFVTREAFALPTAGVPHPGLSYDDPRGYWNKVKGLARTFLDADGELGDDSLALFGTMNLSTEASGSATDVHISAPFMRWVLETIRDGLRPRVVLLLGLRALLRKNRELSTLFEDAFKRLDVRSPHQEYTLEEYRDRRLVFREWGLITPHGSPLLLVDWPQHPSRSPFTNAYWWSVACAQFSARRASLIE